VVIESAVGESCMHLRAFGRAGGGGAEKAEWKMQEWKMKER